MGKRRLALLVTAAAVVSSVVGGTLDAARPGAGTAAAAAAKGATPAKTTATTSLPVLRNDVAPGGNFDLSRWQLQLPVGSPGAPTTIRPAALRGANGYHDAYFFTDPTDGAMTFWAPEKGVTTPNSKYARSELRELDADGGAADWKLAGTHRLNATVRVTKVTKKVCVGQVHLGSGGSSTKPLLELYYSAKGEISLGVEKSPDGGQAVHPVATVPVGRAWSYVIGVTGGKTITLTVDGGTPQRYSIPSSFAPYRMYFKAGSYNQSSSQSTTKGAEVKFYALAVSHRS